MINNFVFKKLTFYLLKFIEIHRFLYKYISDLIFCCMFAECSFYLILWFSFSFFWNFMKILYLTDFSFKNIWKLINLWFLFVLLVSLRETKKLWACLLVNLCYLLVILFFNIYLINQWVANKVGSKIIRFWIENSQINIKFSKSIK